MRPRRGALVDGSARGAMLRAVRPLLILTAFSLLLGCEQSPSGPPEWPALQGPTPSHGLQTLELRAQRPDTEERLRVLLRRDGCFRRETTEGEGEERRTVACVACSEDTEAIDRLFADAKSREAVSVLAEMGKAIAPPIAVGELVGYLFMEPANGRTRRGSAGDPTLERIARQLHEGVPGAPSLGDDRCAEIDPEGEEP